MANKRNTYRTDVYPHSHPELDQYCASHRDGEEEISFSELGRRSIEMYRLLEQGDPSLLAKYFPQVIEMLTGVPVVQINNSTTIEKVAPVTSSQPASNPAPQVGFQDLVDEFGQPVRIFDLIRLGRIKHVVVEGDNGEEVTLIAMDFARKKEDTLTIPAEQGTGIRGAVNTIRSGGGMSGYASQLRRRRRGGS